MTETQEYPRVDPSSATFIVERHGVFALGKGVDSEHIFIHTGLATLQHPSIMGSGCVGISEGTGVDYGQGYAREDFMLTPMSRDYWLRQNHLDEDITTSIALRCYFRRMKRESQNSGIV